MLLSRLGAKNIEITVVANITSVLELSRLVGYEKVIQFLWYFRPHTIEPPDCAHLPFPSPPPLDCAFVSITYFIYFCYGQFKFILYISKTKNTIFSIHSIYCIPHLVCLGWHLAKFKHTYCAPPKCIVSFISAAFFFCLAHLPQYGTGANNGEAGFDMHFFRTRMRNSTKRVHTRVGHVGEARRKW